MDWSGWKAASVVAAYSAIRGEVDCGPMIRAAWQVGKTLLLPRMQAGHNLEFAVVGDLGMLRPGRHGVLEPVAECPKRAIGEETLVLVPGLAFDREGGRLGRGGGYYDRALAASSGQRASAIRVGIGFDRQVLEAVPMTPLDVRMDFIATESGIFAVGSSAAGGPVGVRADGEPGRGQEKDEE